METYDLDIDNYELEDILALFHIPSDIKKPEPVISGHGRGGFVVVCGKKTKEQK